MQGRYRKWLTPLMLLPLGLLVFIAPASADKGKSLGIREQGSFFVGGQVLNRGPNDDITINQMYVQYQIPKGNPGVPVVFTHGCCLSSKSWQTTPDGRMGWDEYFLRQGYPVYLTDQTSRARSGFDATVFNQVKSGALPPTALPTIYQFGHQEAWDDFRFGPSFNKPWPDEKFPISSLDEFWRQMIPDLNETLPSPNPIFNSLSDLAIRLKGAVLVGHSESGLFPMDAALTNASGIRGLILIEPYDKCRANALTSQQMAVLAKIPMLVVFGDHLSGTYWQTSYDDCRSFATKMKDVGGKVTILYPPDLGIFGNSHMIMLDKNNDKIADLIIQWIRKNVEGRKQRAGKF